MHKIKIFIINNNNNAEKENNASEILNMDIFALLDSKNNKTQDDASTQAETKLSHNLEKFD